MCQTEVVYELLDNIDPDPYTDRIVPLESVVEFSDISLITEIHQGSKYDIFVLSESSEGIDLSFKSL